MQTKSGESKVRAEDQRDPFREPSSSDGEQELIHPHQHRVCTSSAVFLLNR